MVYRLKPLPATDLFTITYEIKPCDRGLNIIVELQGDHSSVDFRGSSNDELWKGTCVELFYKEVESPLYTEINVSPNGRNSVAELSDYRKVSLIRNDVLRAKVSVQRTDQMAKIEIQIDGISIQNKSVALAVITADSEGVRRFWGIDHWDNSPDFHRSENFFMVTDH